MASCDGGIDGSGVVGRGVVMAAVLLLLTVLSGTKT